MSGLAWLIVIGIPIVAGIIILESVVAKRKKIKLYTLSDSIVNISCGMLERIFDYFYAVMLIIVFDYLYRNVAPYQIPLNPFTWFIGLLVFDFLAYWHHRWSHEINFLWAAHIVHHQSEELNLTTVFRVSFVAVINRSLFFVWMPLMGFDAFTIVTCTLFLGLYQLFTHSRLIGKLGIFEKFMTTPSHHRVHHARNEKYMDHNYGHIFIIWDKMLGTFVKEDEEPDYGITTGFESANPYYAQFQYWKDLFTRAKRTKKFSDKIKVFIKGPSWTPEDVGFLPVEYKTDEQGNRLHHKIPVSVELGAYVLINTLITFGAFIGLMLLKKSFGEHITIKELLLNHQVQGLVGIILISVFAHGKLIEQTKTSVFIDIFRLLLIAVLSFTVFNTFSFSTWLVPSVLGGCAIMFVWLIRLQMKSNKLKTA